MKVVSLSGIIPIALTLALTKRQCYCRIGPAA